MQRLSADRIDTSSLFRWISEGEIAGETFAQLSAHPRFDAAARQLAANMLMASDEDEALDGIFKDAGRYVCALWAVYAHVTGGLTLPRLKDICASSGLLSPGRARALLLYLRYLGFVELWPERTKGQPARYVPNAAFVTAWRRHLRAALGAACLIEPAVALVLERLDEPDIADAFSRYQGEELLATARNSDQRDSPYVRVFMNRHAGSQMVFFLVSGSDGKFPSCAPVSLSVAALARRFRVSRIHIKRMLDQAEKEDMIFRSTDGRVAFTQSAQETVRSMYLLQLIRLLSPVARVVRDRPDLMLGSSVPKARRSQPADVSAY